MVAPEKNMARRWTGLERLPEMDDAQFERWSALLRERTGLHMPPARKSFLVTSVGLRMREVGYEDYESYYEYLNSGLAGKVEWAALVDRLTVHETRFFRDLRALELVRRECMPTMRTRVEAGETLEILSAGCSTGEEAFTLAMIIDQELRHAGLEPRFGVTGTDISLHALATARQGIYPDRRFDPVDHHLRAQYCEPGEDGMLRISDRLRRRVCFAQSNILEGNASPYDSLDLVYCQNVLIYFDRATRERILTDLVRRLRPGGALVLGAGEMIGWKNPLVERIGNQQVLAFRRVGE